MTDIKELVSRSAAETSPAPMDKVFMVSNRTSCVAFATAEQAHKYIASFSASIGGGMSVTSVPVISDPAPHEQKVYDDLATAKIPPTASQSITADAPRRRSGTPAPT